MKSDMFLILIGWMAIAAIGYAFLECNRLAYERQCEEIGGQYVDSRCLDGGVGRDQ